MTWNGMAWHICCEARPRFYLIAIKLYVGYVWPYKTGVVVVYMQDKQSSHAGSPTTHDTSPHPRVQLLRRQLVAHAAVTGNPPPMLSERRGGVDEVKKSNKTVVSPPLEGNTSARFKSPRAAAAAAAAFRRHEVGKERKRFADIYDRACEIYHAGPKGEGQKVWRWGKTYHMGHGKGQAGSSNSTKYDAQDVVVVDNRSGPSPLVQARLQPAPPRSRKENEEKVVNNYYLGKDLPRIPLPQSPPPPPPPPPPVPAKNDARQVRRRVSRSNPPPRQRFATLVDVQEEKAKHGQKPNSPRPEESLGECLEAGPCLQDEHVESSWRHKIGHLKVPGKVYEYSHTDRHVAKRQDKLKAKISPPQPMMAPRGRLANGRLVNVAVESGGVGGPAAAVSLAVRNGIVMDPAVKKEKEKEKEREKEKGKEKAKEKAAAMDKVVAPARPSRGLEEDRGRSSKYMRSHSQNRCKPTRWKRRDSDLSFTCRGLSNPNANANAADSSNNTSAPRHHIDVFFLYGGQDSSGHDAASSSSSSSAAAGEVGSGPRVVSYVDDETVGMVPVALFSGGPESHVVGKNGEGEARNDGSNQFYEHYDDLLDEYGIAKGCKG
ncbi:hypothetical protein K504DRAFT_51212 [Pleomassaria siparia CBS 279.74]|uniref:Uncharacterized protein n=1 Tax=Pleomassaria siparia CBS 279.74 TaxID=1314801 RepID=A0A6G1K449_9PLEO|nr:hypothetical protein K504DRAFT_51212 [Pleomassaria siparia CBS 279.74]